jgi:hypothetical protein
MTDADYFFQLRVLIEDYENHNISREEYRSKRKRILDALDEQYNFVTVAKQAHGGCAVLGKVGDFLKGFRRD